MRLRAAVCSTLVAALSACSWDSVPDAAVTDCDAEIVPGGAATDLLFVVDDSGSMWQEQDALAQNLGAFVDALVNAPVRLDVRVGVTNTSVHGWPSNGNRTTYGTSSPSSGTPYPAGTLVAIVQDSAGAGDVGHFAFGDPGTGTPTWLGPRILSNGPTLARDFKANVLQGVWGSGKEQPLTAMRNALVKSGCPGANCGFQRSGARLAVVIVTDEDDCSSPVGTVSDDAACRTSSDLYPLDDYVTFLDSTGDGEKPIVALIAGFDPSNVPSLCSGAAHGTTTSAYSLPTRLDDFLGRLDAASPGRTFKESICEPFGPSLLAIANLLVPQEMPLQQAPADWRMLAVALNRDGATVPCQLALAGTPQAAAADAVFTPPQAGALASLTFRNDCTLGIRDRVDLRIVCAR